MSKYLPTENLIYHTSLSPEEVVQRLGEHVRMRRQGPSVASTSDTYKGSVSVNTFKISRIIHSRNSFLPQIKGTIIPKTHKTEIQIAMRLAPEVIVFLAIWCGFVLFALGGLIYDAIQNEGITLFTFIPLAMIPFAYVISMLGFKLESSRSQKFFQKLWEAEMEKA
ncbi:MAG: hypothetical protein AAF135_18755 [Bacteroidota bacterium]